MAGLAEGEGVDGSEPEKNPKGMEGEDPLGGTQPPKAEKEGNTAREDKQVKRNQPEGWRVELKIVQPGTVCLHGNLTVAEGGAEGGIEGGGFDQCPEQGTNRVVTEVFPPQLLERLVALDFTHPGGAFVQVGVEEIEIDIRKDPEEAVEMPFVEIFAGGAGGEESGGVHDGDGMPVPGQTHPEGNSGDEASPPEPSRPGCSRARREVSEKEGGKKEDAGRPGQV